MVKLQQHTMMDHGLEAGRQAGTRIKGKCAERDIKLVALLAK
jgi:hypothetical protein